MLVTNLLYKTVDWFLYGCNFNLECYNFILKFFGIVFHEVATSQSAFFCSKSTMETEQCVKYVQS